MATDIAELEAISQNMMHSNISITDGIYGILSGGDVKGRISALRGNDGREREPNQTELLGQLKKILVQLEGRMPH